MLVVKRSGGFGGILKQNQERMTRNFLANDKKQDCVGASSFHSDDSPKGIQYACNMRKQNSFH